MFCLRVVSTAHAQINPFHKFLEGCSGSEAHSQLVVLRMSRFEVADVSINR